MAQDFGDEVGEWLLRTLQNAAKEAIRYSDFSFNDLIKEDESTHTAQEKLCLPFGTKQDAGYFAAVCKERNVDVTALTDKDSNGFIELNVEDVNKLNDCIPRFVEELTKLQTQQLAERIGSEPVTLKQREGFTEITVLPNLSNEALNMPEVEVPAQAEPDAVVEAPKESKTRYLADEALAAREQCRDFDEFKEILAKERIGVGIKENGEVLLYQARLDENGNLLPYENVTDWAVGADKLKEFYGIDVTNDWFEQSTPKEGTSPSTSDEQEVIQENPEPTASDPGVPDERESTQEEQEQTASDGSMDMDGSTPDINQGIESHDNQDTDAHTARIEREANGTDVPMSEVRRQEERAADLETEASLMRDSSKVLAGGDAAPDHDLSKFMQPER